jgi:hypothetical protein
MHQLEFRMMAAIAAQTTSMDCVCVSCVVVLLALHHAVGVSSVWSAHQATTQTQNAVITAET